jgi:pimeloyl-ACP methyl ester carboxylesterase
MPYVTNEGVRIHYEVEGEGIPLVLQHGSSGNIENWRTFGYVAALIKDYRLILVDARGHGLSDKPHAPEAYRPEAFAGDYAAILAELSIRKAHFMGYSMGGRIGFRVIARYLLPNFSSLILGGASPYPITSEEEKGELGERLTALRVALDKGVDAYLAGLEAQSGPLSPRARERIIQSDPIAIYTLTRTTYDWPSAEDVLPVINVPCLIYASDRDPRYAGAREGAAHIPGATFVPFQNIEHLDILRRSELVLPYIRQFLDAVNKTIEK